MSSYRAIEVWDPLLRACHWLNAALAASLLVMGSLKLALEALGVPEETLDALMDAHAVTGFMFAASLGVRLAYLFGPSNTAHWRDVVPLGKGQREVLKATLRYYMSGFRGTPPLYLAHNPFAGVAYSGFFLLGSLQVLTGSAMYLLGEGARPAYAAGGAAEHVAWPPEWMSGIHAVGAGAIALFVTAHLAALALHDLKERRGLVSSMVSGVKFFSVEEVERLGLEDGEGEKPGRS
jgi:Ni/Fe-hydrogenase 1 B-type cytochrome subunit